MKKTRKKGFSLIELIVVIAVIAAIAAVIVPSISNFSNTARIQAERRNVQLWASTYAQAAGAGATDGLPTPTADLLGEIDVEYTIEGGETIHFTAAEVDTSGFVGNVTVSGTHPNCIVTYSPE